MVKTKIAVLVSGGGTNLQAILDSMRAEKIPHGEIALVISNNRNAYALTRARENGIETAVVSRRELGGEFEDVSRNWICTRRRTGSSWWFWRGFCAF